MYYITVEQRDDEIESDLDNEEWNGAGRDLPPASVPLVAKDGTEWQQIQPIFRQTPASNILRQRSGPADQLLCCLSVKHLNIYSAKKSQT